MVAEPLAAAVLAWLGTYALHSTLLLAAAWVISAALSRSRSLADSLPSMRESLWRVALLAGIVTASVQRAVQIDAARVVWTIEAPGLALDASRAESCELPCKSERAPVGETTAPTEIVAAPPALDPRTSASAPNASMGTAPRSDDVVAAMPAPAQASVRAPRAARDASSAPSPLTPRFISNATPATVSDPVNPVELAPAARIGDVALTGPGRWTIAALTLWIAGVAFGGLRWLREWLSLRRTLRRRVVLDRGFAADVFADLCRRSATPGVRLSCAAGLSTPITIGILRHEIIVPPRATTQLSRDELEAMFAHELAHVRRDDPLWLAIYRALEVVLFFQPLNRVARMRLQDDAELLADDWAATQVEERVSLASCLTEIAGWIVNDRERLPAPAMAAHGSRLSLRVHRLLDDEHHPERARRPHGLLLLAGLAVTGVALFGPGVAAQTRATLRTAQLADAEPTTSPTESQGAVSIAPRADDGAADATSSDFPVLFTTTAIGGRANLPTQPLSYVVLATPVESSPLVARALEGHLWLGRTPARFSFATPRALAAFDAPSGLPATAPDAQRVETQPDVDATRASIDALERELDRLRDEAAQRKISSCLAKQLDELSDELASVRDQHAELLELLREFENTRSASANLP